MGTTRAAWRYEARGAEIAQAWERLVVALMATRPPAYMRDRFGGDLSDLDLLCEEARSVSRYAEERIRQAGNSVYSAGVMLEAHRAAVAFIEACSAFKALAA